MSTSPAPITLHRAGKAILWGGGIAGAWDIAFAIVYYGLRNGATAIGVLQSVAGGLLGRTVARAGGYPTAALGLACHFFIALGAAALFFAASRWIPFLTKRAVISGLLFGAAVYFFMNMVVVPLSAYHGKPWPPPFDPWAILAHMVGVGLPIALATRRCSR